MHERRSGVPAVILTGYIDQLAVNPARVRAVLRKPIGASQIAASIAGILATRGSQLS
ncbi:MAG: hypothetical protein ACJ8AW_53650 [Rhodopila sp.]